MRKKTNVALYVQICKDIQTLLSEKSKLQNYRYHLTPQFGGGGVIHM